MNQRIAGRALLPRVSLWVFSLLLLLNLGLVSWLGHGWYTRYANRYLDQAEQALIAGDQATALRALQAHVRLHPEDQASAGRLRTLQAEHARRYLDQARARLRVNDRVGAIAAYQEQVKQYPEDYRAQLELARLYADLGSNDSAEAVYRGIVAHAPADSGVRRLADRRLFRLLVEWSNGIKKDADSSFYHGDLQAALAGYDKVLNLRARNPALASKTSDRVLALRAYNSIIARRAYTLWRLGQAREPAAELDSDYDATVFADGGHPGRLAPEMRRQRQVMLSNFFWDDADARFNAHDWKQAAALYDKALQLRGRASPDTPDPNTPTLLQDYALSLYRAGDAAAAYPLLQRLRREFPYHEQARVKELLDEVGAKLPAAKKQ